VETLISEIRNCQICAAHLSHGVNPVFRAHPSSRVAIIGQAPGTVVHRTGIPWNDKSGDRLRDWMSISREDFYNEEIFAIVPMGFCYPGKGKSGDLPPRPECAPKWHQPLFDLMPQIEFVLLIGSYAQQYYLGNARKGNLTKTVQSFEEYLPRYLPLPHPSPRNNLWLRKNPWFEKEAVPVLRNRIQKVLGGV
jgi:uracil-DNA glycosylase